MPKVYQGSAAYPSPPPRPVVTIGNFDGVHLGHRVLLGRAVQLARTLGVPACAFTFHPAPRDVLRPGNPISRIQTLDDRIASLGRVGIDHVVVEPFTMELSRRSPSWFAQEVLGSRLGASAVIVGWDFRFGQGRAGTAVALRELMDVAVEQIEAQELGGGVVSSSRIREAVAAGSVDLAGVLLGRPHQVVGTVVPGDKRGRTIGFPTANVHPDTPLLPGAGVYAVRVELDGELVDGMANVGVRPTFGGGKTLLEVHLFGFSGDLYGRVLRVAFLGRLRDERTFDGVDSLVVQLNEDRQAAIALLEQG